MSSLHKKMIEQVQKFPELLLRKLIATKLEEQGLRDSDLVEALTVHLMEGGVGTFHWDDGKDDTIQNAKIHISREELDEVQTKLASFPRGWNSRNLLQDPTSGREARFEKP